MSPAQTEEQKKAIADYVEKLASEWPPLTRAQLDRLSVIWRGGDITPTPRVDPIRPEVTALRQAEKTLSEIRSEFAAALAACQGCNLAEKVHHYQKDYGTGFHEFVPLTPDDTIKVARLYKRKIAAAEKNLEAAKGNS